MLYLTLGVCATLAGLLVYRYDLYEREPWYMVIMMASVGAGTMWLLGYAEAHTLILFGSFSTTAISVVAATHEELARLAVVGLLAVIAPKQFNDPVDGLVYGSILGLGMALTESLTVMNELPNTVPVLPPSEVVRLFGHLVLGGITGYAVGPAHLKYPRWPSWMLGCLSFTIIWHFAWDWIALTARDRGSMASLEKAFGIVLMLVGMLVYGGLVVRGSSQSRLAFDPGAERSVWGWPFTLLRKR